MRPGLNNFRGIQFGNYFESAHGNVVLGKTSGTVQPIPSKISREPKASYLETNTSKSKFGLDFAKPNPPYPCQWQKVGIDAPFQMLRFYYSTKFPNQVKLRVDWGGKTFLQLRKTLCSRK